MCYLGSIGFDYGKLKNLKGWGSGCTEINH